MSQQKGLQWVRPMDVIPFPHVWVEFETKESKDSDKLVKYRIQDLPEDRFDEAVRQLIDNYLLVEPVSEFSAKGTIIIIRCTLPHEMNGILFSIFFFFAQQNTDVISNKDYVDDYERLWHNVLKQKVSLVCFREGSDEIVGLSVLVVNTKNDTFMQEMTQQVDTEYIFNF